MRNGSYDGRPLPLLKHWNCRQTLPPRWLGAADVDWGGRFGAEVVIITWDHELAFPRGLFNLVGASPSDARTDAANKPKVRIRWW